MDEWDPIGIKDEPTAADEYDIYINDVYGLLKRAASDKEILEYLIHVETERMGLYDLENKPLLPDEYRIRTLAALRAISLPT